MSIADQRFLALVRAIARLALPAHEQIAYLSRIGVGDLVDELALDISDHVDLVPALVASGCLDEHEADLILRIDRQLDELSNDAKPGAWRATGLLADQRWERIRSDAREFIYR